jgi:hypothetical protein
MVLLAIVLCGAAAAQEDQREPARELARLMMDSTARRAIDEHVIASMMQNLTATLQQRLNRRLMYREVDMLAEIVRRFVTEALPPSQTEEIAARIYMHYFDAAELREMLQFQRSSVARKVARLAPELAVETAREIDRELRTSPALPDALAELQRAFPVLAPPESP